MHEKSNDYKGHINFEKEKENYNLNNICQMNQR